MKSIENEIILKQNIFETKCIQNDINSKEY